jgi:hypothetical protein
MIDKIGSREEHNHFLNAPNAVILAKNEGIDPENKQLSNFRDSNIGNISKKMHVINDIHKMNATRDK